MKKENVLIKFLKRESVLVIATILAIISMFFVTPSKAYMEYIDYWVPPSRRKDDDDYEDSS